ncbi:riboflavin aldehydeforming enzyme [Mucor ambiguus]|uniref:Riboflavin aldehydeforming enzyme n=1 Tax=Mucor ambiguus TaxID=91626 RepID=A0A0C9M7U6_9FUNG|nr:riboflavin aldehydeforming enzyme [Mucor ambiguus]
MKGILASICALTLLGITNATFPNDIFFHHHPDLVLNKNQVVNKNSQPQDNSRGGRGHYRQAYPPPSRNAYHGNPGRSSYRNGGGAPPNRANYNHNGNRNRYEPRSVAPVQKLSYNKDGSIKWANKLAASYDQQQGQDQQQQQQSGHQYNDYYEGNDGNNKNNNGYYGESGNQQQNDYYGPNNQQQNDYYGSSQPYSGGNQGNNYYKDDQQQSSNPYYGQGNNDYRDYQNDYYGGNNGYGYGNNNNYGSNSNHANDNYGGSDDNNNYGYEDNSNNNDGNDQGQDQGQTDNNNQNAKKNVTAGFAGGIRLAGALPDDGYSRGQGTFYDLETRVGSCGKQNKNSEFVAAVNSEQMGGDNGRNNPNCGKDIEVVGPSGKTIQVTVVDNCKSCKSGGLDLSPAAFEEIGDFSHGSVPIKWKFV